MKGFVDVATKKVEVTDMKMTQRERRRCQLDEQAYHKPWIPIASPDHGRETDV